MQQQVISNFHRGTIITMMIKYAIKCKRTALSCPEFLWTGHEKEMVVAAVRKEIKVLRENPEKSPFLQDLYA